MSATGGAYSQRAAAQKATVAIAKTTRQLNENTKGRVTHDDQQSRYMLSTADDDGYTDNDDDDGDDDDEYEMEDDDTISAKHKSGYRHKVPGPGRLLSYLPTTPLGDPATAYERGLIFNVHLGIRTAQVVQVNFACNENFIRDRRCLIRVDATHAQCLSCSERKSAKRKELCLLDILPRTSSPEAQAQWSDLIEAGTVVDVTRPPPGFDLKRLLPRKVRPGRYNATLTLPAEAPVLSVADAFRLREHWRGSTNNGRAAATLKMNAEAIRLALRTATGSATLPNSKRSLPQTKRSRPARAGLVTEADVDIDLDNMAGVSTASTQLADELDSAEVSQVQEANFRTPCRTHAALSRPPPQPPVTSSIGTPTHPVRESTQNQQSQLASHGSQLPLLLPPPLPPLPSLPPSNIHSLSHQMHVDYQPQLVNHFEMPPTPAMYTPTHNLAQVPWQLHDGQYEHRSMTQPAGIPQYVSYSPYSPYAPYTPYTPITPINNTSRFQPTVSPAGDVIMIEPRRQTGPAARRRQREKAERRALQRQTNMAQLDQLVSSGKAVHSLR